MGGHSAPAGSKIQLFTMVLKGILRELTPKGGDHSFTEGVVFPERFWGIFTMIPLMVKLHSAEGELF